MAVQDFSSLSRSAPRECEAPAEPKHPHTTAGTRGSRRTEAPSHHLGRARLLPSRKKALQLEQHVRLSRSFALPKTQRCRQNENTSGKTTRAAQRELRPPENATLSPSLQRKPVGKVYVGMCRSSRACSSPGAGVPNWLAETRARAIS